MYYDTPPCSSAGVSIGCSRDIHDAIAKGKERLCRQGFRKEICEIVTRAHEGNDKLKGLYSLTNEEVPPSNVLRAGMMLGIVRQIPSSGVVHAQWCGL